MSKRRGVEWWYASALRLLPSELRREYGADMQATFRARMRERHGGKWRLAAFVVREVAGVVVVALSERMAGMRMRRLVAGAPPRREESSSMEHMTREVRHAARRLLRTPAFTAAALFTLSLAIGANATIFTLLERIVLRPLPYPAQERLVWLDHGAPGVDLPSGLGMTTGLYREYARLPAIEALALYSLSEATVTGDGEPARLRYLRATPSLSGVLGARPALGRWFLPDDGDPGGDEVVVLTHQLWSSRFGAAERDWPQSAHRRRTARDYRRDAAVVRISGYACAADPAAASRSRAGASGRLQLSGCCAHPRRHEHRRTARAIHRDHRAAAGPVPRGSGAGEVDA